MANVSFHSNYLKIYFWQGTAFILRFLSMFIVTPYLTKDPTTYGIYTICISVTIFLGYADLGFLRAGQKYAAECCSKGERAEEMKFIGFGIFVLLLFTLLCTAIFLYFGFHPQNLIKDLVTPDKISIASRLLLILAVFTPATVLQRMALMIFEIRLEGYKYQRISLIASVFTIGSVLYFFRSGHYEIVNYFLFSQSINFVVIIYCIWLAKIRFKYNIIQLFRHVRFDAIIYNKTKGLAYSGLYVMIAWIVYYEVDQLAIGKFIGAEKVAIFAIALAFTNFFRNIYGIFFSPFNVRANYFVANKDDEGLKRFTLQLFSLAAPIVALPSLAFTLVCKPFIMTWVGSYYIESINLARLFTLISCFSFISYIGSIILIAKVRIKEMYIIATIQPILYWIGILSTYSSIGLLSFGVFKFLALFIAEAYYFYILFKFLDINMKELFQKVFYPLILPLLFLIIVLLFANTYLPYEKSKINLLIVLATTGISILASFGILYFTSSSIHVFAKSLVLKILNKKAL